MFESGYQRSYASFDFKFLPYGNLRNAAGSDSTKRGDIQGSDLAGTGICIPQQAKFSCEYDILLFE